MYRLYVIGNVYFSLNIFNCLFNNGVGLQVLTTLVTARPLYIQQQMFMTTTIL